MEDKSKKQEHLVVLMASLLHSLENYSLKAEDLSDAKNIPADLLWIAETFCSNYQKNEFDFSEV